MKHFSNDRRACSEECLNAENVKAVSGDQKRARYREHNHMIVELIKKSGMLRCTMRFRTEDETCYAGTKALKTALFEAFNRAIYAGSIKIVGLYRCDKNILVSHANSDFRRVIVTLQETVFMQA